LIAAGSAGIINDQLS